VAHEAGKGGKRRPTNQESFSSNYDLIWGKKKQNEQKTDRTIDTVQEDRQEQLPGTSQATHD